MRQGCLDRNGDRACAAGDGFLITSDLHQQPGKWARLAEVCRLEQPDFVIVAGDPFEMEPERPADEMQGGFVTSKLPDLLRDIKRQAPAAELVLQMGNDDLHTLEREVHALESARLCNCLNALNTNRQFAVPPFPSTPKQQCISTAWAATCPFAR